MAKIVFTPHLRRVSPGGPIETDGATVGAALGAVWTSHPRLRGYVLDDQGRLRRHIAIFLDGERLAHARALGARTGPDSEIYVMQALSGG